MLELKRAIDSAKMIKTPRRQVLVIYHNENITREVITLIGPGTLPCYSEYLINEALKGYEAQLREALANG